jgi:hypothetical protein
MTEDFETVEPTLPERGQNGELEGALAELDFPFLGVIGCWWSRFFHRNILCNA